MIIINNGTIIIKGVDNYTNRHKNKTKTRMKEYKPKRREQQKNRSILKG